MPSSISLTKNSENDEFVLESHELKANFQNQNGGIFRSLTDAKTFIEGESFFIYHRGILVPH